MIIFRVNLFSLILLRSHVGQPDHFGGERLGGGNTGSGGAEVADRARPGGWC